MHIDGMNPEFVREEDIAKEDTEKVIEIFAAEIDKMDRKDEIKKQILKDRLKAYFDERILMKQAFVKEHGITVQDLIERITQKIGERIEISRFVRYLLLEE